MEEAGENNFHETHRLTKSRRSFIFLPRKKTFLGIF